MIIHHLVTIAGCFPNCHPAGTTTTGVQESGNTALGAAALIAGILLFIKILGGKGSKK